LTVKLSKFVARLPWSSDNRSLPKGGYFGNSCARRRRVAVKLTLPIKGTGTRKSGTDRCGEQIYILMICILTSGRTCANDTRRS
jgi:hypothetical protein